jgi:hypothetical protein
MSAMQDVMDERHRQVRHGYTADSDDQNTVNDWIAYITRYLGRAQSAAVYGANSIPNVRQEMVKAVAVGVAMIEALDRAAA